MTLFVRSTLKALTVSCRIAIRTLLVSSIHYLPYECYSTSAEPSLDVDLLHTSKEVCTSTSEKPFCVCSTKRWTSNRFGPVIGCPDLLVKILEFNRSKPRIAFRFFRWIMKQPGFKCSELVFCVMLGILIDNNSFRSAWWVLERVVDAEMHGISDVLLDGQYNVETVTDILDLLVLFYARKAMHDKCLSVFGKMIRNKLRPSATSFCSIHEILRIERMDTKVIQIFELMIIHGIGLSTLPCNVILGSLQKLGKVKEAHKLLKEMLKRGFVPNGITFNKHICCLCRKGELDEAIRLISDASKSGMALSASTYNPLIHSFCKYGQLVNAFALEQGMVVRGVHPSLITHNIILHGLCLKGRMDDARNRFSDMIKQLVKPDIVSYNTLIHGYCKVGDIPKAIDLFYELRRMNLMPTFVTYNTVIDGFCALGDLEAAQKLKLAMIESGISPDVYTYTTLMKGSQKAKVPEMARKFFSEMLANGVVPDLHAYTARIVSELYLDDAERVLQEEIVNEELGRNVVTYNVFIHGLCKFGNLEAAENLLQKMQAEGFIPDHVTYTSLMSAYLQRGELKKGREIFRQMLSKGITRTVVTYTVLIYAHGVGGKLELAFMYFSEMQEQGISPNVITWNALIAGLCKLRRMDQAYKVVAEMEERGVNPNKYTYTLLINENSNMGNFEESMKLYLIMLQKGVEPDSCTHNALCKRLGKDVRMKTINYFDRLVRGIDDENK